MRVSPVLCAATLLSVCAGLLTISAVAQAAPTLAGTEWRLEWAVSGPLPSDAEITLVFAKGQVSGKSAVNRYFASYHSVGEALTFSQVGSTKMAGPEPLMAAEAAYLEALQAVRAYRLADHKLLLQDTYGASTLVFGRSNLEPETIFLGAPVYLAEGRLWVPVRPLANWLGARVAWNTATGIVTASLGDRRFTVDTRRNVAQGNGRRWTPRSRMLRPSGVVYAPLSALAGSLGAKLSTEPGTGALVVTREGRRGTLPRR